MVLLLEAAPGMATSADCRGKLPLLVSRGVNTGQCVQCDRHRPGAAMMSGSGWELALHVVAIFGNADAVRLHLAAAPQAAITADVDGMLPVHHAVSAAGTHVSVLVLRLRSCSCCWWQPHRPPWQQTLMACYHWTSPCLGTHVRLSCNCCWPRHQGQP